MKIATFFILFISFPDHQLSAASGSHVSKRIHTEIVLFLRALTLSKIVKLLAHAKVLNIISLVSKHVYCTRACACIFSVTKVYFFLFCLTTYVLSRFALLLSKIIKFVAHANVLANYNILSV